MTIKSFIVSVEETALADLKAAGHIIEAFAVSEGSKLLAEVKQLPVGTLVLNLFGIFQNQAMTGEQKMQAVVGAVTPVLQALKDTGGLKGLETSVADFARAFTNNAYLDWKNVAPSLVSTITGKPLAA